MRGWLDRLDPERDLLVLTADHGVDPKHPGTDHTREHVPLLAAFAGHGGRRHDGPMADVGASCLRWLTGRDAPSCRARPSCRETVAAALAAVLALLPAGCGSGSQAAPAAGADPDGHAGRRAAAAGPRRPRRHARRRSARAGARRARPRAHARAGRVDGDRATVRARLSYEVRGLQGTFGGTRTLRARRRAAAWRARPDRPARRARLPWQVDRYARTRPAPLRRLDAARARSGGRSTPRSRTATPRMRAAAARRAAARRYLVVVAARRRRRRARSPASIRGLGASPPSPTPRSARRARRERVRSVISQRLLVIWPAFAALDAGPAARRSPTS